MTTPDIGPLRAADEGLNHQIVDTFARVSESDLAWTEKIWVSIAGVDGSLGVGFGLGRYHNRGVLDGYGGVSRGREQWTVRASRELEPAFEEMGVGPLRYEVVEALDAVRVVLEPNDVQPISFDLVLRGVTPPFFEDRNLVRNPRTGRVEVDVIRYHQGGWASGTVTVDGEVHPVAPDSWFGFRDHSWGIRGSVGEAPTDVMPPALPKRPPGAPRPRGFGTKWSPSFLRRPDGTCYESSVFVTQGFGHFVSAYVNEADGAQHRVRSVDTDITYDPHTRFVRGGALRLLMESGEERVVEVEALGESGFFLKTAGYGGWAGHVHGSWRGPIHLDGEHIADCWDDEHLVLLGQLRDTPIRVREGDAEGYGIMQSIIHGTLPELGLGPESDRIVRY